MLNFKQIKFLLMIIAGQLRYAFWRVNPLVILAQAVHETGNFDNSAKVFYENKNLFGMKESKRTPGGFIELGTKNGHAYYRSFWDSIKDYIVRQKHFGIKGGKAADYMAKTVGSGYAEDGGYLKKWKTWYDKLKPSKFVLWAAIIIPSGTIIYLVYYLIKYLRNVGNSPKSRKRY